MLIVMKSAERIDKFSLEGWFVEDETKLARLFQVRSFSFMSQNEEGRKKQLEHDLVNLFLSEGLLLIGGVQASSKANNISMLFYKLDVAASKQTYTPEVSIRLEEAMDKEQCEGFLNEIQL